MNSAHAIAFGPDGKAYEDLNVKKYGDLIIKTSRAPLNNTTNDLKPDVMRVVSLNGTGSYLPYSHACVMDFTKWSWDDIDSFTYTNKETLSFEPFSNDMQNVDTFGFNKTRVIRFRKVNKPDETEALLNALASPILSVEQVQKYVDEAIFLKKMPLDPPYRAALKTDPAPTGVVGLVRFYWLSNVDQVLRYTSHENVENSIIPDSGKDLIVTYPIHPNANMEKINATVDLLKKQFEITLQRSFDVTRIPNIPRTIKEPDTISSNFPTRNEIRMLK